MDALPFNPSVVSITGGTLVGVSISGSSFQGGTISGSTIASPVVSGGTFVGGTLSGNTFIGPTISGGTSIGMAITGATINGSAIGQTSAAAGSFSTLTASSTTTLNGNELRINGTSPQHWFNETDASLDNKKWVWLISAEILKLRVLNDAESVAADIFSCTRSGAATGTLSIGEATAASLVSVLGTTDSTSSTTGSLKTAGGVGVAKALFVGGTSLTLTNATTIINLNRATDGNPGRLQFTNAGGTKYNWHVAVQYNSDNTFEITPSTAAGGATYSSPSLTIAAATGLVTIPGALTVSGNETFNGPTFAVNATSAAGITVTSATTNAVVNVLDARVNSSGTAAAGFGAGFTMRAESTTTDNTIQFELDSVWVVATHASRTSRALFYSQDSGGSRECFRIEASGTAAMMGFFGANAVVRPATSGEATGFTAGGGTTATSTSTWTGNTGSTAYTTNDIVKHLKNLGLIAA